MDEPRASALDVVDCLETRLRRLLALVAAARDMVSVISSNDRCLEHAQELLALADELSPDITADISSVTSIVKLAFPIVSLPPRAA
jgi:hypothetical protein